MPFSERIARRHRLWWGPPWPGRGRGVRDALHRLRERRAFRDRGDPRSSWHCCERWPRTLLNKWNGREFAARHGVEVAEVYWRGSDPGPEVMSGLPADFVVRPVFGANKEGVAVVADSRELLHPRSISAEEALDLPPRGGRLRRPRPVLLEERIWSPWGRAALPLEYKVHVFGGHIGPIERLARTSADDRVHRYYLSDWEPLEDPINTFVPPDPAAHDPPEWLDVMLGQASAIGAELGTFMRIDFFAGERGPVFNEFSSTPLAGGHYTPVAEAMLGGLWAEHCPSAV